MHLPGHELMQWFNRFWSCREGSGPEQCDGVSQQAHDPGQTQTVKEKPTQAELVFVIGLCGLNPGTRLSEQLLCDARAQWDRAEHDFVIARTK